LTSVSAGAGAGDKLNRLLGVGAYDEVLVALERNTGRRVTVVVTVPYGMRSRETETFVLPDAPTVLALSHRL
jgi:hypothetical protein